MSTITTITQAVYFTLRKNLGREAKKPKTPVVSSFFKKLRSEQDKYNKAISPARKLVMKSLGKIYTSVLSSIHKKPKQIAEEVPEAEIIIDMPVITGKCSGFRIPIKSMKSAYKAPKVQEIEIEESEIEKELTKEELDAQFFAQYEEYKKAQEKPKSFWEEFDEMINGNAPEEKEEEEETEIVFMTASTEEIDVIVDNMNECETLSELRKLYRQLCLIHHPDKGGDSQVFMAINDTYKDLADAFNEDIPYVVPVILAIKFPEDMPESVFEVLSTEATTEEEEDFEDVISQDFQVKFRRSVKISAVGLSAKAKKSLKVQTIKSLNKQQ